MANLKKNRGDLILILLSLVPLLFWFSPSKFTSLGSSFQALGQAAGLVGAAMFSLVILLSVKIKWLDDHFNGLNKVYKTHHTLGAVAFILLLLHPIFLTIQYMTYSFNAGFSFFFLNNTLSILFGKISLLLMIVALILTFFIILRYERWKFFHKFLAYSFLLASLHVYLIPSDVSRNLPLRIYMLSLIGAAIFCSFILRHLIKKTYAYYITEVKQMHEITEITLAPEKEELKFKPGQFLFIKFKTMSEQHPFSISSSPSEKELKISVKNLGDYTSQIKNLTAGTKAEIHGPFGKFLPGDFKEQIWVAGGIGIAPFLGVARGIKNFPEVKATLFYTTTNKKEAVYLDELGKISKSHANLKVIPWFTEEKGRITLEAIRKLASIENKEIFLCGPVSMMRSLRLQLVSNGISKHKIYSEEFNLQ